MKIYRLGTRKSELARTQSQWVMDALVKQGLNVELVLIDSSGDLNRRDALYSMENTTPGLFTKQLETALLENRIDLAVHSLKDLPTEQPSLLQVSAVTSRVNPEDTLLIHPDCFDPNLPLSLKSGTEVGTSSLRREAQLLSIRPDLKVSALRGNVPTRVEVVREKKVGATVLAQAGLTRLGLGLSPLKVVPLSISSFTPAPGQGALAIETRTDLSSELSDALKRLNDEKSRIETQVERSVLKALFGGCTLPLGVRCDFDGKNLKLKAFLGVLKDRKSPHKEWVSFQHFDIQEVSHETLVSRTTEYLKGFVT